MPSRPPRFLILLPALALLACQGDRSGPVEPTDRALESAGACKSDAFVASNPYSDSRTRNDKEKACKTILDAVKKGDHDTAENGINVLQSALFADYASCVGGVFGTAGTCVLQPVGSNTLQETVANFSLAVCNLDPALPQGGLEPDCLPATAPTLALNDAGGTNDVWGGWIAFGPVGEASPTDDIADAIVLPNGEYAILLNDLETSQVFGAIRENNPTPAVGPCPVNAESEKNCEQSSYAVDLDTPGDFDDDDPIAGEGLYVEVCEEVFGDGIPGRGAGTTFSPVTLVEPPLGILGCTRGGTTFAASTWLVLSSEDAVRTVRVIVTSTSASVSEGTIITVIGPLPSTAVAGTCTTAATGTFKESACIVEPDLDAAPGTLEYTVRAEKVQGTGSHTGSGSFTLSLGDPVFGVTKDVGPISVGP